MRDDEAALLRTAEALLGLNMATEPAELIAGAPHEGPGSDLPIPTDTEAIGHLRGPDSVEIVLESSLAPADLEAFYRRHFIDAGWRLEDFNEPDDMTDEGGTLLFLASPDGTQEVSLKAQGPIGGRTEASLQIGPPIDLQRYLPE